MINFIKNIRKLNAVKSCAVNYAQDKKGVSLVESAILFPVLFSLMMAVYDIGQGVVINQKTVSASQIIADLITRQEIVDFATVTDIVNAGELALAPYPTAEFGYDIVSVVYDEDEDPVVLWRVTDNMPPDDDAVEDSVGLGTEGEGVVVVSVVYEYTPFFSNLITGTFEMTESAFLRGRKSATVACVDCP